jgi:hypothetical protein
LDDRWNADHTSRWSRGSITVPGPTSKLDLELTSGRWVSGHVVGPDGSSLDRNATLLFTSPGSKLNGEEVRTLPDHSFRFAVPSDTRELDITLALDETTCGSSLHFEAPADSGEWALGELQLQAPASVAVIVLDDQGEPLQGAAVRWCDARGWDLAQTPSEPMFSPSVAWPGAGHTGASGRLLIQRPPAGDGLLVLRSGFEPRAVFELPQDAAKAFEVQLKRSAELRIMSTFPSGFPDARLIVQIEAARPAVRLFEGMRRSSAEEAESALSTWIPARHLDENSAASWSYSRPFLTNARWPAPLNAEPTRTACIVSGMIPGVPMHVRVLDPTGKVFLEANVEPLLVGEVRELNFAALPPLAQLRGRVLDATGSPVDEANVHFGSLALAPVATTDANGRFVIEAPFATSGALLIERAGTWMGCGPFTSSSGHTPTALFFDEDFHFDAAVETDINLPERDRLTIHLVDNMGQPFDKGAEIRLMATSGTQLLSSDISIGDAGPEQVLFRPRGVDGRVIVTVGSLRFERFAPALVDELEVTLPSLGLIRTTAGPGIVTSAFGVSQSNRLAPHDGRPAVWRSAYIMEGHADDLRELLPGTYTLQLFRAEMADPALEPIGPAIEVTIRAGQTTEIHYER